jgi:hypothetical protein
MRPLSAQLSPRVASLLKEMRTARGRLIFALDATMSRESTWDVAAQLQSAMFEEAAKIGGLDIQLVFYRGRAECAHTDWTADAQVLMTKTRRVQCEAGTTQIARVLRHIRAEHTHKKVDAAVFIGDAIEESPPDLYDAAVGLPPCFVFQEGDNLVAHVDRHGQIIETSQSVDEAFRKIAELTKGAYGKFDASAAKQLGELLRAVAAFAVGGISALADQRTDSARKLLGQMK